MELKEKEFWDQLRRSVDAAEANELRELQAAEQFLADVEPTAQNQLTEDQINDLVSVATAVDPAAQRPVTFSRIGFSRIRFSGIRFSGIQRTLAAAAALMVAPKFIIAATTVTAITAVTVTTVVMQYSTTSLPFQEAIEILHDPERPENERHTSALRVFADVMESILLVRDVANEDSQLSPSATELLDRMRSALTTGVPFEPSRFPDGLVFLGDLVADRNLTLEERRDALERLADQMLHGVSALDAIADTKAADRLGRDSARSLERLQRLLAN